MNFGYPENFDLKLFYRHSPSYFSFLLFSFCMLEIFICNLSIHSRLCLSNHRADYRKWMLRDGPLSCCLP